MRLAYKDYACNFYELLEKDKSVTIHKRNLRALVIEMYKIYHRISPSFIIELEVEEDPAHNTRNTNFLFWMQTIGPRYPKNLLAGFQKLTVSVGKESFRWLRPKLWN